MDKSGLVIDGKYELLANIGEGGMSRVYLARDKRLNKQWAVKELKTTGDRNKDKVIADSFVKEANMMKLLDHPYLPRIVDIVNQSDTIYVIMDYIEGQSLAKILRDYGPQPQESVIEWGLGLCEALDYLHTRTPPIIYRDMKPANIMLHPDGTVRIVDFGTAREYKPANNSTRIDDTTILGTRGYAAPEQFGGIGQTDPRTDVYCLGATLYHLLTGKSPAEPPYEIFPIRQINPAFSPGLEKIITKCVQQNPAARYQNCAELHYALENYDKADDSYYNAQKRKLKIFIFMASLTLLLVIGGVVGLVGHNLTIQSSYDGLLERVAYVPIEEREQYYLEAIDLMPSGTQAYIELINFFEEDGKLDNAEYSTINMHLDKNRNALKSNKDYPALAFEVAKLYWYYFEEKDTYSRSVLARGWYKDAMESSDPDIQKAARLHNNMTALIIDLSKGRPEGMTAGSYRQHFNNLSELTASLEDEPNAVIKLKGCTIVLVALQKDARFFKVDGVSKDEADSLCEDAFEVLDDALFERSTARELYEQKQDLLAQRSDITEVIEDAFAE